MEISFGFCQCGCGNKTNLVQRSQPRLGLVIGEHRKFCKAHHSRLFGSDYTVEDHGYKTPCWAWNLSISPAGYGQMKQNGRNMMAHRVYYERLHGPLPKCTAPLWLELDHLCRLPRCVNPDHLELVTRSINQRRGLAVRLCESEVLEIRSSISSQRALAIRFGVSCACISKVVRFETWKDVIILPLA